LQQAWLSSAECALDEVRRLYHGKHKKIVERVDHVIEQKLHAPYSQRISLSALAGTFGISPGHLSRTFKQVTGLTFERYLMVKRVELAKRLLLEPLNNASQVAEKCGFSDSSYFARVFRKIAGCSPSDYAKDPGRTTIA
jgi:AraC-like DNA-binding protein